MAVQDFLNGGYYGKLGATVGQRWKNIRTIRSYVIPHNPQTKAQQSNRARFGAALKIASEALAYNKGAPCWQVENMTEFNKRVQTAKTRLDNGVTGWLVLPLYPEGTTPTLTLSDITVSAGSGNTKILSSTTLATLTSDRKFTFSITVIDTETQEEMSFFFQTETVAGSSTLAEIELDSRYTFPDPTTIIGISCDDTDHNGEIIYIAPQNVSLPSSLTLDDITAEYYSNTEIILKSSKSSLLSQSYTIAYTLTVQNAVTQTTENITGSVNSVVGGDYFAKITLAKKYALYTQNTLQATATPTGSSSMEVEIPNTNIELGQRTLDFSTNTVTTSLNVPARDTATYIYNISSTLAGLTIKGQRTAHVTNILNTQTDANINGTLGTITNSGMYSFTIVDEDGIDVYKSNTCTFQNVTDNSEWILLNLPQNASVVDSTQTQITVSFAGYTLDGVYPAYKFTMQNDGAAFTASSRIDLSLDCWIPTSDTVEENSGAFDHTDTSDNTAVYVTDDYGYWVTGDNPAIFIDNEFTTSNIAYSFNTVNAPSAKTQIITDQSLVDAYEFDFGEDNDFVCRADTKQAALIYNGFPDFTTVEPASTSGTISYYNANTDTWTDINVTNYTVADESGDLLFTFPSLAFNFNDGDYIALKNVPVHFVNDYIDASQYSFNTDLLE